VIVVGDWTVRVAATSSGRSPGSVRQLTASATVTAWRTLARLRLLALCADGDCCRRAGAVMPTSDRCSPPRRWSSWP